MSNWLIEEVNTGLVDGYYANFNMANEIRDYFQNDFPDLNFIIRQQIKPHRLHDCELITESGWFKK